MDCSSFCHIHKITPVQKNIKKLAVERVSTAYTFLKCLSLP